MGLLTPLRWTWRHPANAHRRGRAVLRAVAYQIRTRVTGRPIAVPLGRSSRIWAVRGMHASTKGFYANPPDFGPMQLWLSTLAPGDLFVDVGANVGTYTILASEAGADVLAFEPNEISRSWLRRNLELNGYQATILDTALAEAPGTRRFTTGRESMNRFDDDGDQLVVLTTLDEVLGDREAFLKVDVEGFEYQVLLGARRALREKRLRLIQLEWNSLADRGQLEHLLRSSGYDLFGFAPDGSLARDLTGQDDVVAVPS